MASESDACPKTEDGVHDWRVDPRVILPSSPPRARIVCAECGAVGSRGLSKNDFVVSDSPKRWPKA